MAVFSGSNMKKSDILKRVGNIDQIAGIREYTMHGSKAEGLKLYNVRTGSGLEFDVLKDKCMDVCSMSYKGTNLSFLSKPGMVSSEYYNPFEMEFLRTYQGGMMYTCGLSNVGSLCEDNGVKYPVHGRIGHTPAGNAGVFSQWINDDYIMEITGEMREAALFGENFVLRRTIATGLGENSLKIKDSVENQGFEKQPLMLLYHFNIGYPLLDKSTKLYIPTEKIIPRDEQAKPGADSYNMIENPVNGYMEQVFYHNVRKNGNGIVSIGVINEKLDIGIYISYDKNKLPVLVQWKSMKSGDYALGIEPANCHVEGRLKEKERGTLQYIEPGEIKSFSLELGILDGSGEINKWKEMYHSGSLQSGNSNSQY